MCDLIGGIAKAILDDCDDRAIIIVDEEDKIVYNNCFALSLVSLS